MKKIFVFTILMMFIFLSACGESADMECIKNAARDGVIEEVASIDESAYAKDASSKVLSVTFDSIEDIGNNQYKVTGVYIRLVQSSRSSQKYKQVYELVVTFNPRAGTYIATDLEHVGSGLPIS